MKYPAALVASCLVLLVPSLCSAYGWQVKAVIHGGDSVGGQNVMTLVPPIGDYERPPGPKKLFQRLMQLATVTSTTFVSQDKDGYTTSTFVLIPGERVELQKMYMQGVISATDASIYTVETFHPIVILGASKGQINYSSVADPSKIFYFDGSTRSYHQLQRQIFGSSYMDPIEDKYYELYSQRPKKKFLNCRTNLKCFMKAAKKCTFATLEVSKSLADAGLGTNTDKSTQRYEIWGRAGKDTCMFYTYHQGFKDALKYSDPSQGLDGLCVQKPSDYLLPFQNAEKGIYSFNSNDPALKNCHGLYYSSY